MKDEHEHPCPSAHCLDQMRERGEVVPDDADCCICVTTMTEGEWEETALDWPEQSQQAWRQVPGPRARPLFVRWRPSTRQQCARCITEIHELGAEMAGPLGAVRWKVSTGSLTQTMCERHKRELEEQQP